MIPSCRVKVTHLGAVITSVLQFETISATCAQMWWAYIAEILQVPLKY